MSFGINSRVTKLIEKVKVKSYLIEDIALEVANGISTGGDKFFRITQNTINKYKLEDDLLEKVLVGREIDKYTINDTQHKVIYSRKDTDEEKYPHILKYLESYKERLDKRSETKKGILPWYSLGRQRYKELFTEDKILIRQTSDSVIATFDDKKFFVLNSILVFKIEDQFNLDYKFVTAVLNSKLTTYIYQNLKGADGLDFAEVKPKNIRQLYIPKADKITQEKFTNIVNVIMEMKSKDNNTSALENELDTMIYKFYNLSPDEIAIVEGTL